MNHKVYNGDNIDFLNTLNEDDTNKNSVDFCYIDPPYNTGNTKNFVYRDNFRKDDARTKHQVWLDWIEKRLVKTVPLLKPTGVIAVSIDDKEVHHLRLLMDKVFGEDNFIAQVIVDGGNMKNNAKLISVSHEYLLVYGKSVSALTKAKTVWRQEREGLAAVRRKEKQLRKKHKEDYATISAEMKEWLKGAKVPKRLRLFHNADAKGLYTYADLSAPGAGARYDVLHPESWKPVMVPSRGWGLTEEKMQALITDDMIIFGAGPDGHLRQPFKKLYLKDGKDQVIRSIMSYPSRTSTHLLEQILGERGLFNNPKNLDFMKFLVDTMCPEDGVVLDYFAGSGSTGHAVLDLNEDSALSERVFILCTNNENGIHDRVTKPRLDAVVSGKWLNGKVYPAKTDASIEYITLEESKNV